MAQKRNGDETGNRDEQVAMVAAALPSAAPDTWTLSNSTRWAGVPCPEPIGGQDVTLAQERRLRGVPTRRDRSPPARSHPHPVLLRLVESLVLCRLAGGRRPGHEEERACSARQCPRVGAGAKWHGRDAAERLCSTFSSVGAAGCRRFAAQSVKLSKRVFGTMPIELVLFSGMAW